MYGIAAGCSRQVKAATGANTITPVVTATALELWTSSASDRSKFQAA
jgi:hypothetical protein